ncbi:MAG: cyclic nucleotide-binding domain-containing protein [Chloroflexaceae bacterium]|nr:cyclic nucleotide-binding domain-containing protein [Chloroflexaceae bacterium]
MDQRYLPDIVAHAQPCSFESERLIFHQGERARHFYILQTGHVALEVFAPDRGPIRLMTLNAGEVLGWSWLFAPYIWHFDARAIEPTHAIMFDGAALRAECDTNHELGYHLMRHSVHIIEQRLQACMLQMIDIYGYTRTG